MTFLAPWMLAAGAAGAFGMVLLHLVAWQRPAAYVLPTTRFIPDQRAVVSRAATRPRDVLLLLLRVLTLLAAAMAFARPVLSPSRGTRATIVLADHSAFVADNVAMRSRVQAATQRGGTVIEVPFDTSLNAGLIAARRKATEIAADVDSVDLVILSPLVTSQIDRATSWTRSSWPGAITIERLAARRDTTMPVASVTTTLGDDDPLAPTIAKLRARTGTVRLTRALPSAADSLFARNGGTVVHWPASVPGRMEARGLVVGDEVLVAVLGAGAASSGFPVAEWADGSAAASQMNVGTGCIRTIAIGFPAAGDLPLHAPFQRIVRHLLLPCGWRPAVSLASDSTVKELTGSSRAAASSHALRGSDVPPTPLVKWLLTVAIAFAIAELLVRSRLRAEPAAL